MEVVEEAPPRAAGGVKVWEDILSPPGPLSFSAPVPPPPPAAAIEEKLSASLGYLWERVEADGAVWLSGESANGPPM